MAIEGNVCKNQNNFNQSAGSPKKSFKGVPAGLAAEKGQQPDCISLIRINK